MLCLISPQVICFILQCIIHLFQCHTFVLFSEKDGLLETVKDLQKTVQQQCDLRGT